MGLINFIFKRKIRNGIFLRGQIYKVNKSVKDFNFNKNLINLHKDIQKKKKMLIYSGILIFSGIFIYENRQRIDRLFLIVKRITIVGSATIRCFILYNNAIKDKKNQDDKLWSETHKKASNITLKALEKNGGIFIKLGQHITALTYLLPKEWTDSMYPLLDKCPQSKLKDINNMFYKDVGMYINDMFDYFDSKPVGIASLAQVHVAKIKNSDHPVAVKIQHPSLIDFVPLDIYLIKSVLNLVTKIFPEYPMNWLSDELEKSIVTELDFTIEAKNSQRTSEFFKDYKTKTALIIPKVIFARPRILIMEYIPGSSLKNYEYLKQNNINVNEVSKCLSYIFNIMIFKSGVGLHCDPHNGNLAIRCNRKKDNTHNFDIILYDHGLYRQIPEQIKNDYSHFWFSILINDVAGIKKYAKKIAGVETDEQIKIFVSAITGRPSKLIFDNLISIPKNSQEIIELQNQFMKNSNLLKELTKILSSLPRILLLILKTNDLYRNLCENLKDEKSIDSSISVLMEYCSNVVINDYKKKINMTYTNPKKKLYEKLKLWVSHHKKKSYFMLYRFFLKLKEIKSTKLSSMFEFTNYNKGHVTN